MKNKFAEAMKNVVAQTTSKILAVFCVALVNECEWSPEDARYLCEITQCYWQQIAEKNVDVFAWCEDETGIDMRNFVNEKKPRNNNLYNFRKLSRTSGKE